MGRGPLLRLGGLGRGLDERRLGLDLGLGGLLGLLGLLDRGLLQTLRVGETADAIGRRLVDARRVALDADLELLGEVEHDRVLDAQLSRQLVDPDLLGSQSRLPSLAHGRPGACAPDQPLM